MPRRHEAVSMLIALMSFPLSACTSSHLGAVRPGGQAAPAGALITVENHNTSAMRVYLLRGTTRVPLGSVDTLERRTFAVPTSVLGHSGMVRLLADPLGSRETFGTEDIAAGPGDLLTWKLAPFLSYSSFTVRRIVP